MNRTLARLSSLIAPLVALGVVLVIVTGFPRVAHAKPKVALTAIEGDTTGDVSDAVGDALEEGKQLTVLYPKLVTRAIDKLGYDVEDLSVKQARKLAAELEADAVVLGTLERDGKRKVLRFRLFVRGTQARGFKVTFNNAKSENFRTQLRDKFVERLGGGRPAGKQGGAAVTANDDEDPVEGKRQPKQLGNAKDDQAEDDEEDEPDGTKKQRRRDGEDEEGGDDEEIEAAVRRVSPHAANRIAVRLDVGVSVQNRRLVFTQRGGFPEGPRPYTNSPVPGARFEAELYPFAFMNPTSAAAGLGFAAAYDKTLALTLQTSAEPTIPVKANQQHWSVGARYRIVLGSKPTSPTITLGAGYGKRAFTTDRSPLMDPASLDVPDITYTIIDPGLAFRIPLGRALALTFGGRALVITDAGPIQEADSYGRAKVYGGSGQAGFDIVLGNRFAIRIVGEFTQIGFAFTGTGDMSNARDMDPASKDIGGAADRSFGGVATLAVLY